MASTKILFLVHHPIEDASSRYRIFQFIPALKAAGFECVVQPFSTEALFEAIRRGGRLGIKLSHTPFAMARRFLQLTRLQDYDLVFIHREAFPFFTPLVEEFILRNHPRVVFSFDDAIQVGHDRSSMKYSWLYKFKYGSGVTRVIQQASAVIVGSQSLADSASVFNNNVTVIPTVVDMNRYPYQEPADRDVITVGWYGSNSTSQYLSPIVPALQRLAETYPGRIRFRFFGDEHLALKLPELTVRPFCLDTEIKDLQSMDIGLMPLPDTPWTRAKCAFKAIQYMALGIPTVVTPIGMSGSLVQHDVNGLHATTIEEWFLQLDRLVREPALRRRLAVNGRETIRDGYSVAGWAGEFIRVLQLTHAGKPMTSSEEPGGLRSCA